MPNRQALARHFVHRAMNATLLLTGFEPFGGDTLNPSLELAQALDGETLGGLQVRALALPCVFGRALSQLDLALRVWRPGAVVCLGLAAGRAELSVERVAVNLDDARIPDNAGQQPCDAPVVAGGPAAYLTRLPVKAMVQAAQQAGVPAGLSHSAGSFVCNHVFYGLLHRLRRRPQVPAGFVHVPLWPEMLGPRDDRPVLARDDQLRGLRAMLAVAAAGGPDLHRIGGTLG